MIALPPPKRSLGALLAALALVGAFAAAAGARGGGTLHAGDVGIDVLAPPHSSTVIAIDDVTANCAPAKRTEHQARVATFAENVDQPAQGAQLNQIVYDLPSKAAATSFFDAMRAAERRRASCSTTEKAANVEFSRGPKGVGDARFTVASDEKISGATRKVVDVHVLAGSSVTELIFIDWGHRVPATTTIAKRAVTRLR